MDITLSEKQLISYFVDGQEDACLEIFSQKGPEGLRCYLGVSEDRDDVWSSLYDYFLFEKRFDLLSFVRGNASLLTTELFEKGSDFIRQKLHISRDQYDLLWKQILDILLERASGDAFHDREREHVKNFFRAMRKMLMGSF